VIKEKVYTFKVGFSDEDISYFLTSRLTLVSSAKKTIKSSLAHLIVSEGLSLLKILSKKLQTKVPKPAKKLSANFLPARGKTKIQSHNKLEVPSRQ
jgi:hypothetical protein